MKHGLTVWKVLVFALVFIICASQVGRVRATTIQEMINAAPDGGTVIIPAGNYYETLTVDKNITLTGASMFYTILQPAGAGQRVISVTAGHNLTLNRLEVTGGQAPDIGGGVYLAGGSLVLNQCLIDFNTAGFYGGGVYQAGPSHSVTAVNSFIEYNGATNAHGGGLYVEGSAVLTSSQVKNNTAYGHGGGMHVAGSSLQLVGGLIRDNTATTGNGGGVNLDNDLTIDGTEFDHNTAGDSGGGLTQWNPGKTVSISHAFIHSNSSVNKGGGAYLGSTVTLSSTIFAYNTVDSGGSGNSFGGGLYASDGIDGNQLQFISNSAKCTGCLTNEGGGLYANRLATGLSKILNSRFDSNSAWSGGGISSATVNQLVLADCIFTNNNTGINYGGGLNAGWLEGTRLLFENNYAANRGGAVDAGVHLVLTNSRFIYNIATITGGGAISSNKSFKGTNLLFAKNIASKGAALYVYGGTAELDFATIARPTRLNNDAAIYVESGANLTLKDSLVASYGSGILVIGTVTEDYNLVFNNDINFYVYGGSLNQGGHSIVNQDPLFVNPSTGDYHLSAGSPAIGNGIDLVPGVTSDLDGRPRLGRWDIGAYQYWAFLYLSLLSR